MGELILGQQAGSASQLYECDSKCGRTRRITADRARVGEHAWPPKFPETAGPCVCPKGGVFIKI